MKNWWIKFGCFLTGYKYHILVGCSEVSQRAVKRYTAAIIIICILWAFIGFSFVGNYLKGSPSQKVFGAVLFVLIILQVERQIILSDSKAAAKYWIRGFIAVVMAIIGSIIIDQIIFQEDIKHRKVFELNAQVDSLMPSRQAELKRQIAQVDSSLLKKEAEHQALNDEILKMPFVKVYNQQSVIVPVPTTEVDSNRTSKTKVSLVNKITYAVTSVENPKKSMMTSIDNQIKDLRAIKMGKDSSLIKLRENVQQEASANTGFLYELQLMYMILKDSGPAFTVWVLWFLLLFGLEIFIMVNKLSNVENDYDLTLQHHMELQKRKLRLMAAQVPFTE